MKLFLFVALALVATPVYSDTVAEAIFNDNDLSYFAHLLWRSRPVLDALVSTNDVTVFAPTNSAIQSAGLNPNNRDLVLATLFNHVVAGDYDPTAVLAVGDTQALNSLLTNNRFVALEKTGRPVGQHLLITRDAAADYHIRFNSQPVQDASITALSVDAANINNGRLHKIDRVMFPPTPVTDALYRGQYWGMGRALNDVRLTRQVDNVPRLTIFVPQNNAFQNVNVQNPAQLDRIVKNHIIPDEVLFAHDLAGMNGQTLTTVTGDDITIAVAGGVVSVGNADVTANFDQVVRNGVIHEIDEVINAAAALVGTCANQCGSFNPAGGGNCHCDFQCKIFNDCCDDFDAECPNQNNGFFGGPFGGPGFGPGGFPGGPFGF